MIVTACLSPPVFAVDNSVLVLVSLWYPYPCRETSVNDGSVPACLLHDLTSGAMEDLEAMHMMRFATFQPFRLPS